MEKKKRFKVKGPAMWNEVPSFTESTYDEIVTINYGVGYCDNSTTAEKLRHLGYTVTENIEEVKVEEVKVEEVKVEVEVESAKVKVEVEVEDIKFKVKEPKEDLDK